MKVKYVSNLKEEQTKVSAQESTPASELKATIKKSIRHNDFPTYAPSERQIKYLGLIIEKDAEYDEESLVEDGVPRRYLPIREKYIQIVKNSRALVLGSYERKSRRELKKTYRNLRKIGQAIAHARK